MSRAAALGVGERDHVALVGGGGKSTLLFEIGHELAGRGSRVLLTTTTKMGSDQAAGASQICHSADPGDIGAALDGPGPVMLVTDQDERKISGPGPEVLDRIYAEAAVDHVLVEADGSRGRPLKAPGPNEPVIPASATLVIVVMGIDAVGRPIAAAAHRPPQAAALLGVGEGHVLSPDDCAAVVAHPDGGLKGVPDASRVAVAITKARSAPALDAARRIVDLLAPNPRIGVAVVVGGGTLGR